jgi:branched-chain amino acid transport system substrate-binding protein
VKRQFRYAITAALVAATSGAVTAAQAEIRIGAIFSVTGPAAFLGEPERRTVERYVDKINAAGGVNGEKI